MGLHKTLKAELSCSDLSEFVARATFAAWIVGFRIQGSGFRILG